MTDALGARLGERLEQAVSEAGVVDAARCLVKTPSVTAVRGDSADCAPERTQLDLFLDTQDTVLVNRIVASLLEGSPDSAEEAVARLRAENPEHPDLPMFVRLWQALRTGPPDPGNLAGLRALIESLKGLIPAADRLLAGGARAFLLRWWQTLAQAGVELPSAEAEPPVRYWLALARHHLGDEREH